MFLFIYKNVISVVSHCIILLLFSLLFSLGFDACLKELPYLDFLKHLAGPPVSSGTAVDPPQSSPMSSPEPVEDVEELSPERAIQRVKELITASSDTFYKVQTI